MGGAGLSETSVMPIFRKNYCGSLITTLVSYYMTEQQDVNKLSERVFGYIKNEPSHTLLGVYQSINSWIDELFKTKLYHMWSCEQLAQQMAALGLSPEESKQFVSLNFDGEKANAFFHFTQQVGLKQAMRKYSFKEEQLNHCERLVKWISTLTLKIVPVFGEIEEVEPIFSELTEFDIYIILRSMNLLNLKIAHNNDKFQFDFKVGKELMETIQSRITQYYHFSKETPLKTFLVSIILSEGGSGSGKSRMLIELPSIIRNINHDIFKRTRIIHLNCSEMDLEIKKEYELVSMLTSRIIVSSFEDSRILAQNLPESCTEQLLYDVFETISRKLHSEDGIDRSIPIPIVLALDDFQNTTISAIGKSILQLLSCYITNHQKDHGLLLIPAFGITPAITELTFIPNDLKYSLIRLKLPCLEKQAIQSIMENYNELKDYYNDYSHIWNIIGSIPKHLEYAISEAHSLSRLKQPIESTIQTICSNISIKVNNLYSKENIHDIALICLSGLTLSDKVGNETIQDKNGGKLFKKVNSLKQRGLLYEINSKYQLPLLVLDKIADNYGMIKNFITRPRKLNVEILSELCLKTILYRFKVFFSKRSKNGFEFENVFDGALYSSNLKFRKVSIKVSPTFRYIERNNALKETDCNESTFYKTKNGDGLTCLFKINGVDSLIFIQSILKDEISQLTMNEIVKYYWEAKKKASIFKRKVLILLVTNQLLSEHLIYKIEDNELTLKLNGITQNCSDLMIIYRDCFRNFFNEFITQHLK